MEHIQLRLLWEALTGTFLVLHITKAIHEVILGRQSAAIDRACLTVAMVKQNHLVQNLLRLASPSKHLEEEAISPGHGISIDDAQM